MSSTSRRRTAVAALALGAFALAGVSSAAAQTTIDPEQPASLSIHKYEEPETATGLPHNGTEIGAGDLAGLTAIEGVEFTIKQVPGIDLLTNEGWKAASDLTLAGAATATAGVTGTAGLTDVNGLVKFDSLPLGLYYVQETVSPVGATPAAPFLVTLPLTHPTSLGEWMYDVHVYPKNVVTTGEKTVEDHDDIMVGDTITWTILGEIPNGGRTDAYRVVDPLDSKLTYVSTAVSLTNGATLTLGTDYTVAFDAGTNTVTVDFTEAGLDILAANSTAKVKVVIDTVVNSIGEIENVASIFPNQPSIDDGTPVVTPPAVTKYGTMVAKKVDGEGTVLAGASFQVFTSLADAKAGVNPISIEGVNTWTSGADGIVTISGLRYSNFVDGKEIVDPADWQHYYLVEVKAPEGFELLAAPIQFDVTNGTTDVDLEIENTESNGGFELPLTGAQGLTTLIAAGTLLLAGSVLLTIRSRRSVRESETV